MPKAFIFGVGGGGSVKPEQTKTVELSMADGNQEVSPDTGKVLTRVTVNKPATFIPDNIKKDVTIGGVTGTYAGGSATLPTLRTVSISRSGHTLTISNPSTNGTFVTGYKIYDNGTLVFTQSSTSYSLLNLGVGVHSVTVKAYGTNFNDSVASSAVSYSIYSITNTLTNLTNSNSATYTGMQTAYSATLTPVSGKYLPQVITVTIGGAAAEYTYNNSSGAISIAAAAVTGNIVITAAASDYSMLAAPVAALTGAILSWAAISNATLYSIRCDGVEVATTANLSFDLSTLYTADGSYPMTVVAQASGYQDSNPSNTVSYSIDFSGTLADNTWAQIAAAAEGGTAGSLWAVGDEKDVTLTTGETITLRILGFNHDTKTAGGTAGITFGMKNLLAATYYMNSSSTNAGGWGSSYMRNTTMATLYTLLPEEVKAVIKPVNKLTSAGSQSSTINTTSDSLFLLSEIEVFGVVDRSFAGEGTQYAWFAAHNTAAERIKYLSNGSGSANYWWLRSPRSTNSTYFCAVSYLGYVGTSYASYSYGVELGFCV